MMSDLLRLDVELYTHAARRDLHTSGHATHDELKHMLELVRPRCFIPVHGARHHLHNHAELARRSGVEQCLVIENGQVAGFSGGRLTRLEQVRSGRVSIDRGFETLSPEALRQRAALGRTGIAQLSIVLDRDGALRGPAQLSTFGVATFDAPEQGERLAREVEQLLQKQSKLWQRRGRDTAEELEKFLGWRLERLIGRRPQVSVQISQL